MNSQLAESLYFYTDVSVCQHIIVLLLLASTLILNVLKF